MSNPAVSECTQIVGSNCKFDYRRLLYTQRTNSGLCSEWMLVRNNEMSKYKNWNCDFRDYTNLYVLTYFCVLHVVAGNGEKKLIFKTMIFSLEDFMTGVPIFQVLCVNNWFSHWNKFFFVFSVL